MGTDFGKMVGCLDAIEWLKNISVPQSEEETKQCVLARMQYEFEKENPVPPRYHKGKYGSRYDTCSCGSCGFSISITYKYCPGCGKRITDAYHGRRKTAAEQGERY